jgi:hypothetical protein
MIKKIGIVFIMVFLVLVVAGVGYIFSPAASQARAEGALSIYLQGGQGPFSMQSCVSDTDGDGYASCGFNSNGVSISVQCASSLMSVVPLFGSRSCKIQSQEVIKLR